MSCWKPLIISFCFSLGSTLLLTEKAMIDPLHLWVINPHITICVLLPDEIDLMNYGFMIRLFIKSNWVFSELYYAWLLYLCISLRSIHLVWPTRLIYIYWERCFVMGSILCSITQLQSRGQDTYLFAINGKAMGIIHIDWVYFGYH